MIRKAKILVNLDYETVCFLIESFYYLGLARLKLITRPFSKIAPSLGVYMSESNEDISVEQLIKLKRIRHVIRIASKYTFWESKCLVRAMAAMMMLNKRGIESTLYLGTCKDEAGKMIAHAWLRSGTNYVTGYEEMHRFTVTGKFSSMHVSNK